MRILIVNKYYFGTGGPEHYLFSLTTMLENLGHKVIHFSVSATKNQPSAYSSYFVSSPVGADDYDMRLAQKHLSSIGKLKVAGRAIYSREAYQKLRKLIRDTHPDIVYVLNFTSYLSPSVIDAAHDEHVPVVVQLLCFDEICANNVFLRDNQVCTECLHHKKYHGIVHRCVNGSLSASVARVAAMYYHDAIGVYNRVSAYSAPSQFMIKMMTEDGFPRDKFHHIPLFVDVSRFSPLQPEEVGDYILYFGRVAPDKGVSTLVEAYALLGSDAPPLVLMGWPEEAELTRLQNRCRELNLTNVHFIGPKQGDEVVSIVQRARVVVVPSIWFENTPHTVYEAFACGRPVIATNLGSLSEQVVHEHNGLLFELKDAADLARQLVRVLQDRAFADWMGANGLRMVREDFNAELHVQRTLDLFDDLIVGRTMKMPAAVSNTSMR